MHDCVYAAATLAVVGLDLVLSDYVIVLLWTALLIVFSQDAASVLAVYLVIMYSANVAFGWTGVLALLVLYSICVLAEGDKIHQRSRSQCASELVAYLVVMYSTNVVFGWTGVLAFFLLLCFISLQVNAERMHKRSVCTDAPSPTSLIFECQVCLENQPQRRRAMTSCSDCSLAICETCLRQYLTLRIESGQVSREHLCCPGCRVVLPQRVLTTYLSVELYATLRKMVHDASERPACPYGHCAGTVLSTPHWLLKRRVTCSAGHGICVECNRPYHVRPTCVDKAYAQWKKVHEVRSCPQCNRDIERNGGCKHMTCVKCWHEFCWLCRAPWSGYGHPCTGDE
ncbi:hypothetical protein SPRG_03422 [Saprolegnia parasitica CBS 223.65]|uniref:RBR-type E3 ubiquitin transferase n=1 Tax=Saprolegnia parasitica (strain CBS 223.65) TaxID=695850 RepID=A0A067CSK6_SAPPC|nr:hypothetical protein SPRG_03422 [Saprolegnia parasitica CBS 223.65]KDO32205.1 hypothetical protein SPRG_03422 [Saprolegnia parasitica CBS 223.65]|eukprot:XP_012197385.1 hypothetical protein SPRG_03422 [Saprolegnia parasitica CBS 223.65]